ncbi:MAG: class I SAM-dependent methyltransferase [Deltaproteobacteria bacterium]
MANDAKFWNRFADRYIAGKISNLPAYERKLELTKAWFTPETEVLEFASGSGITALKHAPFVKHIRAIDYAEKMVTSAKARAKSDGITNVTFELASIEGFPEDQTYDAVLGMSVVHLLKDRVNVFAKVNRLLKPGGIFVQSTTCLSPRSPLRILLTPLAALGLVPHVTFITIDALTRDLDAAGFTIATHWQATSKAAHFIIARKPGDDAKLNAPKA